MLAGKPVFRGIQAEGLDWMTCFSKRRSPSWITSSPTP